MFAPLVVLAALAAALTPSLAQRCSMPGDPCCPCDGQPQHQNEICQWPGTSYCDGLTVCSPTTLTCELPPVPVPPQSQDCGNLTQPCCEGILSTGLPAIECIGDYLCSSGQCVEPNVPPPVLPPNQCMGLYQDCPSEDEECFLLAPGQPGLCQNIAPSVNDSSVGVCGHEGEQCCSWPDKQCVDATLSCASGDCVKIDGQVGDSSVVTDPCTLCGACVGSRCCGSFGDCADDMVCINKTCAAQAPPTPAPACGANMTACCPDGSCADAGNICNMNGVCVPASPPCSNRGDSCCNGMCNGTYLACDTYPGSAFNNRCVQCGGLNQPCCTSSNNVTAGQTGENAGLGTGPPQAYTCSGSNMGCNLISKTCVMLPGSCDAIGKGCCIDDYTQISYCNGAGITCDQQQPWPHCVQCGGSGQLACLKYDQDFTNFQPKPNTRLDGQCLLPTDACSFDPTKPASNGRCYQCGQGENTPCCWQNGAPYCNATKGLLCQEKANLGQPTSIFQCISKPLEASVGNPALCGSNGQKCCDPGPGFGPNDSPTSALASRCGAGLACNLTPDPVTGQETCEICGGLGMRCCYSTDPDVTVMQCNTGLGCTNDVTVWNDRTCQLCGGENQPACWSEDVGGGYFCNPGLVFGKGVHCVKP